MISPTRITSIRTLAPLALAASLVACTGAAEDTGAIEITLKGVTPEGVIYRLPVGTTLTIAGGRYRQVVGLDDDVASISVDVPVGSYTWSVDPPGPATFLLEWPLEREDPSGTTEIVPATLVSYSGTIVVTPGVSVPVALQFDVVLGARITFVMGTVDISVDISETVGDGGAVDAQASLDVVSAAPDPNDPNAPYWVFWMPRTGETGFTLIVSATVIEAWQPISPDEACAYVSIDALTGLGPTISGQGFSALLTESGGFPDAETEVCVTTAGELVIKMTRNGGNSTGIFDGVYAEFATVLNVSLETGAFDGQTVDLSVLSGAQVVPATALQTVTDWSTQSPVLWYTASYVGQVELTFTPMPLPQPL